MNEETAYLTEYWLPYIESHRPEELKSWTKGQVMEAAKSLLRCFQKYNGFTNYTLQQALSGSPMEVDLENSILIFDPCMMIAHIHDFSATAESRLVGEYYFDADLRVFALNEARKHKCPTLFDEIWESAPPALKRMSPSIFYNAPKQQKVHFPSSTRAGVELVRQCWQFAALGESVERFSNLNWVPHDYDAMANACSDFRYYEKRHPEFFERIHFLLDGAKSYLNSKSLAWQSDNSELRKLTSEWQHNFIETSVVKSSRSHIHGRSAREIVYDFAEVIAEGAYICDVSLLRDRKEIIDEALRQYTSELRQRSKGCTDSAEELQEVLRIGFRLYDFIAIDPQDKDDVRRLNQSQALKALMRQKPNEAMFENEELGAAMDLNAKYNSRAERFRRLKARDKSRITLPKLI